VAGAIWARIVSVVTTPAPGWTDALPCPECTLGMCGNSSHDPEAPVIRAIRTLLAAALLLPVAGTMAAQTRTSSPSPTLPSDTLQANYAPPSMPGPMPELAPSLPSDTLEVTGDSVPVAGPGADSLQSDSMQDDLLNPAAPMTPGDSVALRELRSWIKLHPTPLGPPPVRAVLVRA
jgi:hypothetical protein